ncbi:hypothetical protein AX17_002208 [Amanita inopinata Kibby_2008]|nr:hypothetical protein AX17_002208 [Amanita inopinata Kibby_2008]
MQIALRRLWRDPLVVSDIRSARNTMMHTNWIHGLILVYSEPGPLVSEAEYHDWYENEHIAARLTIPGMRSAVRYHACDEEKPAWLILYDTDTVEVLKSKAYTALGDKVSERGRRFMSQLEFIKRKVCEPVASFSVGSEESYRGTPIVAPLEIPSCNIIIHIHVSREKEKEFNEYVDEEFLAGGSLFPGWMRSRRFKLVETFSRGVEIDKDPGFVEYVVIHELDVDGAVLKEVKKILHSTWVEGRMENEVVIGQVRMFEKYKQLRWWFDDTPGSEG